MDELLYQLSARLSYKLTKIVDQIQLDRENHGRSVSDQAIEQFGAITSLLTAIGHSATLQCKQCPWVVTFYPGMRGELASLADLIDHCNSEHTQPIGTGAAHRIMTQIRNGGLPRYGFYNSSVKVGERYVAGTHESFLHVTEIGTTKVFEIVVKEYHG